MFPVFATLPTDAPEAYRRRWTDRLTPSQHVLSVLHVNIQIVLALLVAWMLYLALWPQHGLVINAPLRVTPSVVRAGEALTLIVDYDQPTEGASDLGLFLASGGRLVTIPTATIALPAGSHRIAVLVPVPRYTPPGSYKVYLVRQTRASYFAQAPLLVESPPVQVIP